MSLPLLGALIDARFAVGASLPSRGEVAVFAARDTRLNREVRLLAVGGLQAPAAHEPVAASLRALGSVDHPSLPTTQRVGLHDGAVFVVVDVPRGETLEHRRRAGARDGAALAAAVAQICDAAAVLHAAGFVLGPVSAADVWVRADGHVTLAPLPMVAAMDPREWTPGDDVAALRELVGDRAAGDGTTAAELRDTLTRRARRSRTPSYALGFAAMAALIVAAGGAMALRSNDADSAPSPADTTDKDPADELAFLGEALLARRDRGQRVPRQDGPDIGGTWVQDVDSRAVAWLEPGPGDAWRWCQSNAKKGAPPSKNRFFHCGDLDLVREDDGLFLIGLVYDQPGYDGDHEILVEFEVFSKDAMTLNASLFRRPGETFRFAYFDHKFVRSDAPR